jgi:opacity protein-like surface antigen
MFMCAIPQARASGNIDLFLGQKNLDKDFGSGRNIEDQDAIGLFFDWGQESWPVHIALDLLVGSKDNNGDNFDVDLDGSTAEILVGVRWYPAKASDTHWMPHLGGGLGLISGKVKADDSAASDDLRFDDSKLGLWGDAGVQYRFGKHFKVGGRVKYSRAKVDNPGGNVKEIEAGGLSYGIDGGWTW